MKFRKIFTIMLFGCFTTASISSHALGRKYSEIRLSSDTFIVSIKATNTTTPDKALSGLLTRAAEVTIKNGYKYFIITDKQDQSDIRSSSYFDTFGSGAIASHKTTKVPHGQMTIKCFKTNPKANDAIDAKFFLENKK
jgi:hypothetical protein